MKEERKSNNHNNPYPPPSLLPSPESISGEHFVTAASDIKIIAKERRTHLDHRGDHGNLRLDDPKFSRAGRIERAIISSELTNQEEQEEENDQKLQLSSQSIRGYDGRHEPFFMFQNNDDLRS